MAKFKIPVKVAESEKSDVEDKIEHEVVEPVEEESEIEHVEIPEPEVKPESTPKPISVPVNNPVNVQSQCTKEESKAWNLFHRVSSTEGVTRVLLYGKPGTGKTTQACKSGNNGFYSIPLNEDSSVSELLGMFIPKGNEFVWTNGVGIRAWIEGKVLVLNEIDHAPGAVTTICHALLDDKEIAAITLPNTETVRPTDGFKVIATMNGSIADLPLALLDRFDVKIDITEPHPEAVKKLPDDLQELVKLVYSNKKLNITFREIIAFNKLRQVMGDDAFCVFGNLAEDVKTVLKLGKRDEKT